MVQGVTYQAKATISMSGSSGQDFGSVDVDVNLESVPDLDGNLTYFTVVTGEVNLLRSFGVHNSNSKYNRNARLHFDVGYRYDIGGFSALADHVWDHSISTDTTITAEDFLLDFNDDDVDTYVEGIPATIDCETRTSAGNHVTLTDDVDDEILTVDLLIVGRQL